MTANNTPEYKSSCHIFNSFNYKLLKRYPRKGKLVFDNENIFTWLDLQRLK